LHQVGKSRLSPQPVEYRLGIQLDEIGLPLRISLFEPRETFFLAPARGVDLCRGLASLWKVAATAPVVGASATGNEFHHIGMSADGKTVACGGLLRVLKGQDQVFFLDVANPRAPQFRSSANPALSAITDDFQALPNGGFLVTMMGGAEGHQPGRVAEFDGRLSLVKEYPEHPPMDGFNPHGLRSTPFPEGWLCGQCARVGFVEKGNVADHRNSRMPVEQST
jgi:hypothetical protein